MTAVQTKRQKIFFWWTKLYLTPWQNSVFGTKRILPQLCLNAEERAAEPLSDSGVHLVIETVPESSPG